MFLGSGFPVPVSHSGFWVFGFGVSRSRVFGVSRSGFLRFAFGVLGAGVQGFRGFAFDVRCFGFGVFGVSRSGFQIVFRFGGSGFRVRG